MSDHMQCDDCGKSTIFDHDASYRCRACCSQAYRDHHELYVAARADLARQARTIRRMRALADGYKANARKYRDGVSAFVKLLRERDALGREAGITLDAIRELINAHASGDISMGLFVERLRDLAINAGEVSGAKTERARIVAALRFEADAAAKMPGDVWAGVAAAMAGAANYIERGEHLKHGDSNTPGEAK